MKTQPQINKQIRSRAVKNFNNIMTYITNIK